nr:hypothetical protein [Bacilli bacterium]
MKKNSLLKAILIAFGIAVILSWIIPAGGYSSGTFTAGTTNPVGIINLFRLPVMTMQTFIQYTIVFLSIGALYGVLNKTGVYGNIVSGIAKKWKGKEKALLVIITIAFALIGSLTGLSVYAFLILPFVAAILMMAGFDKFSSLLATVGALLVGEAASIFGFSGAGYIINVFGLKMTDEVITKIILFVLLLGLYLFFVIRKSVVGKKKEEEIPFLVVEKASKKSKMPLIIISVVFLIISLIGMYNWYYGWGVEFFNNLDTKISSITIGTYPIMSNILNGVSILGYWGNYEFAVAIVIVTFIIAWVYNVKLADLAEGAKDGMKEILPVAIYATICNIIFTVMLADQSNMYATIVNWLNGIKGTYSVPVASLISASGSLFYNDFYYLLYNAANVFSTYEAVYYPVLGVLTTGIFGIFMMVLPTSVMLVAGLKYFNVSYTEWLKKMWLYLLEALVVLIIVVIVVTMMI